MAKKRTRRRTGDEGNATQKGGRWKTLEFLIRGNGDLTIGRVGPISCAATAADGDQMLAALVRRPRESFEQLLDRLDAALTRRWDDDVLIDEING